ncbi:YybH family protein [Hyphococcus sp.]|uniref:YybH family protein n=1 Tax=Hyphococcus sp. TaxID=2038636 RepID=UPI00207DD85B|nr:MAG: hypothetical protein DHS20C04_04530 [Marinicaulis sp.]
MKTKNALKSLCCLLSASLLISGSVYAKEADSSKANAAIEKQVLELDRLLFDEAFNKCDLELYKKLMSPTLEFYDDRSGLNTSFDVEVASFNDRCSKSISTTRKLVKFSAHVLGDYGAVELGEHDFFVDGKKVQKGKFIIIWEKQPDDSWVMKRTISYDHEPASD